MASPGDAKIPARAALHGAERPPIDPPPPLVAAIEESLKGVRPAARERIKAARELFSLFTRERSRLKGFRYLDVPRLRAAYLRYHVPLNAVRVACVLEELLRLAPRAADLEEVVDLGSGPGTASLVAFLRLPPDPRRTYQLVDRSGAALKTARDLFSHVSRAAGRALPSLEFARASLPHVALPRKRALVWLAMVLNELSPTARERSAPALLLERLASSLEEGSFAAIIEPGLRAPGRRLLELHDAAVASGAWRVLAPCTHQAQCPLLRLAKNPWCHFHLRWRPPSYAKEIALALGLDPNTATLSYLILERSSAKPPQTETPGDPTLARVIGDRMRVRGGEGFYICRMGRREIIRRVPETVQRGDRLRLDASLRSGEIETAWPA